MSKEIFEKILNRAHSLPDEKPVQEFLKGIAIRKEFNGKEVKANIWQPATGITLCYASYPAKSIEDPIPPDVYETLLAVLIKEGIGFLHTAKMQSQTHKLTQEN